jgi:DNA-binding NtrC family response regulator
LDDFFNCVACYSASRRDSGELRKFGLDVTAVQRAEDALALAASSSFDALLLDLALEKGCMDGETALAEFRARFPELPVVILTGTNDFVRRRDLLRAGAADYVYKWPDGMKADEIAIAVQRALRVGQMRRYLARTHAVRGRFVAKAKASREAMERFETVAGSSRPAVIAGEPGTGKRMFAAELYRRRRVGDLFSYDATDPLVESEAMANFSGNTVLIENADLLTGRVRRRFEQLSGGRLILTSSRPLEYGYLFARCDSMELPPLRRRMEDFEDFARHFLARFDEQHPGGTHSFEPEAMTLLRGRLYPLNFIDLRRIVERAALHSTGPVITAAGIAALTATAGDPEKDLKLVIEQKMSWQEFETRYKEGAKEACKQRLDELWNSARCAFKERNHRWPLTKEFVAGRKCEQLVPEESAEGEA